MFPILGPNYNALLPYGVQIPMTYWYSGIQMCVPNLFWSTTIMWREILGTQWVVMCMQMWWAFCQNQYLELEGNTRNRL